MIHARDDVVWRQRATGGWEEVVRVESEHVESCHFLRQRAVHTVWHQLVERRSYCAATR